MADYTFNRGGEIIITLGNVRTRFSALDQRVRQSGIIIPKRKPDYLPRRKSGKKGNLNFYDLGEYQISGNWVDDQKSIVPTVTQMNDILVNGNPATRFEDFFNLFLDDIRAAYNEKPAATNLVDWKNAFRRLSRADGTNLGLYYYDVQTDSETLLNQNNSNWTESGLKIAENQNFNDLAFIEGTFELGENAKYNFLTVSPMHLFPRIFDSGIKITGSLDFSAAALDPSEIAIDSQKEINYFLSRQLKFPVFYSLGADFSFESLLNYSFFAITRRNSINSPINVIRSGYSGIIWDAVRHYARIDNAREIQVNHNPDGSTNSFAAPIPVTTTYSDFPLDADGIRQVEPDGSFLDFGSLNLPFSSAISGCLLGAINQENNWFFIWQNP